MQRVWLNLYDAEDSLLETIEIEVSTTRSNQANQEIETPGG
jgi:hypothetical protein